MRRRHPSRGSRRWCEHADGLDDVEATPELPELEDVGLAEFDVRKPEFVGFPLGVREACETEVDREDLRAAIEPRELDGVAPRAASGDEDVHLGLAERVEGRMWKRQFHLLVEREVLSSDSAVTHRG